MDTQTRDYYKSNAKHLSQLYARARNPIIDHISLYVSPQSNGQVLDAGCGTGVVAQNLAKLGFSVTGCDPVPALYQEFLATNKQIQFFTSTLEELNRHPNKYQAVSCQAVLQHIPEADLVSSLTGLVEVCEHNGYLFISVLTEYHLESSTRDKAGRLFHLRDKNLYIHLFRRLGCRLVHYVDHQDSLGRPGIAWVLLIFQKEALDGASTKLTCV
jgi:2-polyprenyl-3-methyl-5-hydroxy-6-metoxy-1,4-benzoquinol methylase